MEAPHPQAAAEPDAPVTQKQLQEVLSHLDMHSDLIARNITKVDAVEQDYTIMRRDIGRLLKQAGWVCLLIGIATAADCGANAINIAHRMGAFQ